MNHSSLFAAVNRSGLFATQVEVTLGVGQFFDIIPTTIRCPNCGQDIDGIRVSIRSRVDLYPIGILGSDDDGLYTVYAVIPNEGSGTTPIFKIMYCVATAILQVCQILPIEMPAWVTVLGQSAPHIMERMPEPLANLLY
jgi:hypothetical protein